MRCHKCQHENPAGAKFCVECASPLARICPACGGGAPPTAKFCPECAAPLTATSQAAASAPHTYTPRHLADKVLRSKSALEGERKQVTVLFADVKGSMELAEQVDPEEWHRIMERFFEILTEGVHRFEGTINQYTGDGIMALFGAPIAHEDHAQRACYAALYLRDALRTYADELRLSSGLNFSVRMGMNSGEVVVGKIGDDLRMDYTAQGHAVGLAARMEQLAEPGTVLLTAYTAALVSGYFTLRDLGASTVKGSSEPLHVYELASVGAVHTRLDLSRARGLSRFVGREQEMAALEAALARTTSGEGQLVGIVAEAGAGKSRLCYEFTERCRSRGLEVLVASAVPHGRSVPFLPVLQILRALCGVTERETGEDARRKIAGALLWRDDTFRDDLPLLFDFLGVADPDHPSPRTEPEVLQRRLFSVIQRLIHTRKHGAPAVLLFEDLHWMDGASAAALESLIETVPATRTFLLVNFRPGYHAVWMDWSSYQSLPLRPLIAEATTALLFDLLGPDSSVAELAERIRQRAAGNPFFLEEIVQSLVETGALVGTRGAYRLARPVTEMMLPATVQAGLAARIDRLSDSEKHVLQAAAVIGREFAEPVLQRVAERSPLEVVAALHALVAAEFLYQAALYPETQYAFKHPLTQEVAYRSQLSERRARVHASAARAIIALYPDKLDEYAALLAQHWEGAGDATAAAEWHCRAAVWVGVRDRSEMLRHWRQVRALLDTVPATPETLRTRVLARIQILHNGLFLGQGGTAAAALFQEAMDLATELHDPSLHVWLLGDYAMAQQQAGALADALVHATEGVRLADASGQMVLQVMIRVPLMWVLLQSGRLHEAVTASEEAERLSHGDPEAGADVLGFSPYGSVLTLRAAALAFLGRLTEATAAVEQAIEIGQRRRDAEVLNWAHTWGVQVCWIAGEAAQALRHGQRAVEFGEVAGSAGLRAAAGVGLARAYLLSGQYSEALETLNRAAGTAAGRLDSDRYVEPLYLSVLARAHLGMRDLTRARESADRAVGQAGESPTLAVAALLARAKVLLATDGTKADADIEAHLRDATKLIETIDARGLAPFVHEQYAELARLRGDEAACKCELREAYRLFTGIGASGHAGRVARDLAAKNAGTRPT